jgi:hypothetical protein
LYHKVLVSSKRSCAGGGTQVCQEVKSLDDHMLAAIEKEDAEALSILRARHESVMLSLADVVRYQQWAVR